MPIAVATLAATSTVSILTLCIRALSETDSANGLQIRIAVAARRYFMISIIGQLHPRNCAKPRTPAILLGPRWSWQVGIGVRVFGCGPYSFRKILRRVLCTRISPLYSTKPNFRKRFMKKLTRDRVVPIISAKTS